MINALIVGAGGFFGSMLRYLVGLTVTRFSGNHWFPFATLTVNVVGCFVIGVLGGYLMCRDTFSEQGRLFVLVGILGGFTTFSSFGNETVHLIKSTHTFGALLNVVLHMTLCLGAAWWGHHIVK
ncbi:MAG: fluoride efflux transporter CrcB [Candidatus Omnitrophica bacterium]|nr:fluoride efflux transporter CrcB [Candidatus Omnitrophota bacterium]